MKVDRCILVCTFLVFSADPCFVIPCIIEKAVFINLILDCEISKIPTVKKLT